MTNFAVVFPGQGSQSLGMLATLSAEFPGVEETFKEASEVLGLDLWHLAQNGPKDELNATLNTQPLMLAAGVAVWRVWKSAGGCQPLFMAGHSLGEYTALVCSGAIPFTQAVKLVAERARQMQSAVPEGQGAMAAILGLEDAVVEKVCADSAQSQILSAVNYNSPGQVVIAGEKAAVKRAMVAAKTAGAKRALALPVSVPSHCELMRPAAKALLPMLEDTVFTSPEIPVIHNADVAHHDDEAGIREALAQQLYLPVRWVETVQFLASQGVEHLVECGPGKVLAGLTRRIDKNLQATCVFDPDSLANALQLCAIAGE